MWNFNRILIEQRGSKFLPLFVVLVHMTLIGAKIIITHIAVGGIILKFFAAA
jgi:hypothetical protein